MHQNSSFFRIDRNEEHHRASGSNLIPVIAEKRRHMAVFSGYVSVYYLETITLEYASPTLRM